MRSEQEVLVQVLQFARSRDSIRAVVMNGSRVNPNAPQDFFCDYDVACYGHHPRQFVNDQGWLAEFGELVILQQNDYEDHGLEGCIFLMLFRDGVRIDLSFNHLVNLAYLAEDTLTQVLLDKDDLAPALPPPSDTGYLSSAPTRKQFDEAVNEVFWCSNNVAKGLWRGELTYVKYMQDVIIREALLKLLEWYAAMRHNWTISPGKMGKWLEKYLPREIWEMVVETYAGAEETEIWDAMFAICHLARRVGVELAAGLGYSYPMPDDERTVEYLQRVRALPKDAISFD